jgi:hypothetical protein
MNWLTNFVRPKLRALVKRDTPDNLWHKCPGCGQMIFHRDLEANLHVCDKCGHHLRLPALKRLAMLFDDGAFTRIELPKVPLDPLRFRDRRRYTERLKEAQAETEEQDAIRDGIAKLCADFDDEYWRLTDETGIFPEEFVAAIAQGGWLGVAMPENVGGAGLGLTTARMLTQAMGGKGLMLVHEQERAVNPVPKRLADISLAMERIGFAPKVSLEDGLRGLVAWWRTEKSKAAATKGEVA